ncbi:hypothetical protein F5Y09DRAFT_297172 [Xylaria sp. FL1042]|nr:hypothetical protein F5Y09DRAFT_297172 [Xylaria sp. FL1042]
MWFVLILFLSLWQDLSEMARRAPPALYDIVGIEDYKTKTRTKRCDRLHRFSNEDPAWFWTNCHSFPHELTTDHDGRDTGSRSIRQHQTCHMSMYLQTWSARANLFKE